MNTLCSWVAPQKQRPSAMSPATAFVMSEANSNKEKINSTFEGCVPFDEFKEALGPVACDYSDEEIEQIRITFDKLADNVFNNWLKKVNSDIVIRKEMS